jgi:hypothetical protein
MKLAGGELIGLRARVERVQRGRAFGERPAQDPGAGGRGRRGSAQIASSTAAPANRDR